jgi:hypothetical protein
MFSATVNGTPPLTYFWFLNQTNLILQTQSMSLTATLTIANAQPTNAGTYHLVVSNVINVINSAPFILNVETVLLSITQQPAGLTVGMGENAVFGVSVTGSAPHFFQWFFNGTTPLSGATNPVLTITNAQLANAGNYHVVITNIAGAVTSNPALLQVVNAAPTNVVVTPGGVITNILIGDRLTFTATNSGSRPLIFQWFLDGLQIVNETNATLVINNVTAEHAGSYTVEVSNAFGRPSAPALLVLQLPRRWLRASRSQARVERDPADGGARGPSGYGVLRPLTSTPPSNKHAERGCVPSRLISPAA